MLLGKSREIVDTRVHQPNVIGVVVVTGAFTDDGTSVALLHPVVAILGAHAVAAFIAHRPNYDRRMVLVALDHVLATIQKRLFPFVFLGKTVLAIALRMRLVVSLVDDVNAKNIAKYIPPLIIRIMAGSHAVDVVFKHQLDVAYHCLIVDVLPGNSAVFVAVHAFNQDWLAIHQKLSVFHLSCAESYICSFRIDITAIHVSYSNCKRIKIRFLSRPWHYAINYRLFKMQIIEPCFSKLFKVFFS